MKGVVLAGGTGSRLWPMTRPMCKQLLPVFNKPMIYYPLSTLMLAGIRELLLIVNPGERNRFEALFGDGSAWGMSIRFAVQDKPSGIAEAITIAAKTWGTGPITLILGDNLFFGDSIITRLKKAIGAESGATVFAHRVANPSAYGVVTIGEGGLATDIEEKPTHPKSSLAVTGLYVYDESVTEIASGLKPSSRGELEITDVNLAYLRKGLLSVEALGRGAAWLDMGSPEDLLEAANLVRTIEGRQGVMVGCPEEIAYRNGWIGDSQLLLAIDRLGVTPYAHYLKELAEEVSE